MRAGNGCRNLTRPHPTIFAASSRLPLCLQSHYAPRAILHKGRYNARFEPPRRPDTVPFRPETDAPPATRCLSIGTNVPVHRRSFI